MKIAAIIVTYNRKDKLKRCIEAILSQESHVKPDVIVVDNNSSDGTEVLVTELMHGSDGRLQYFNLRYNSGGAGGFCFGVREAVTQGYDYLWLMDDDCIPERSSLQEFLTFDHENSGKYGFLSSRVLWTDGSLCRMNIQRRTVFRSFNDQELTSLMDPCRIEMASFVSAFIPAYVVRDIGLPIRKFFIWTDDWEYTRRISRKYPCWLIPTSEVLHDTDNNSGADISAASEDRIDRFRYLYRNDVFLYRREGLRGVLYEAARLSLHTMRIARTSQKPKEKVRRIGLMLGATLDGLSFHPEPERASVVNSAKTNENP